MINDEDVKSNRDDLMTLHIHDNMKLQNDERMKLHSKNFDLCRLCMCKPELDTQMTFFHIFNEDEQLNLSERIFMNYGITVTENDMKPKIICECCFSKMLTFMKEREEVHLKEIELDILSKNRLSDNPTNSTSSTIHQTTQTTSYNGSSSDQCIERQINQNNDSDSSCILINDPIEMMIISSDSEDSDTERYYCTICQKKVFNNHDCSQHNIEFSTCLVPFCCTLSRSIRDFTSHYKEHKNISPRAILCEFCFQEKKIVECFIDGRHMKCMKKKFKCYQCNTKFNSMPLFANHKLRNHQCTLKNYEGDYLCYYCEKSSPDPVIINNHMMYSHRTQIEGRKK